MSAGRRNFFDNNDKITVERYKKTLADVEAGRVSIGKAAKAWNRSKKSIQRDIELMNKKADEKINYTPAESFEKILGVPEWKEWLRSQRKPNEANAIYAAIENKFWSNPEVWNRKDLHLLTKEDFVKATNFAKNSSEGSRFGYVLALRYLIRGGFGKHEWLSDFMRTKKLKQAPKFPKEFYAPETFLKVLPAIENSAKELLDEKQITSEEYEEFMLIQKLKRRLGPRTGKRRTEKEVWGTTLNSGKTNLLLDDSGKILMYDILAKGDERWTIKAELIPSEVKEVLEPFVQKRQLKTGDHLISMTQARASEILRLCCTKGKISSLRLHDLRKWFGTAMILSGVPMEQAAEYGVGWKSVQVLKDWYAAIRGIKSQQVLRTVDDFLAGKDVSSYWSQGGVPKQ